MGFKHQTATQTPLFRHDPEIAHDLKSWTGFFDGLNLGDDEFDDRVMDRDFMAGDIIRYHEFDPITRKFTGRECDAEITRVEHPVADLHPAIARLHISLCG